MPISTRDRVHQLVNEANEPVRPKDLYSQVPGIKPATIRSALMQLASRGLIRRVGTTYIGLSVTKDIPASSVRKGAKERLSPEAEPATRAAESESMTVFPILEGHRVSPAGRQDTETGRIVTMPDVLVRQLTGGRLPQGAFWTFACGPSGEPFISDGMPVLVEPTADFVEGAIYALWLGEANQSIIKRVQVHANGSLALVSDNTAVATRRFTPTEDGNVWTDDSGADMRLVFQGRVIWPTDTARAAYGLAERSISQVALHITTHLLNR